jgi:hypothetical protein
MQKALPSRKCEVPAPGPALGAYAPLNAGRIGKNSPGVYFPGAGQRDISADMGSKVRSSARMPGATDGPPPARSSWSDDR